VVDQKKNPSEDKGDKKQEKKEKKTRGKKKKSTPTLKLTYFGGRGRAETTRIMLKHSEFPFEDIRFPTDEDASWKSIKEEQPYGQLPVLTVSVGDENTLIAQSHAIEFYVAELTGMNGGRDLLDRTRVQMISHGVDDLYEDFARAFWGDEKEKGPKMELYFANKFLKFSGYMEKLLKSNNGGKGFFVGDDVTLADIKVYVAFFELLAYRKEALKDFPLLSALVDRVASLPNIAVWIKERPQTPY